MKYIISIALIIIFIIASIAQNKEKKKSESVQNQLVSLLKQGRYDEFDTQVKDAYENGHLNSFNYNYMRMNRYILCSDKKNMDRIVKEFATKNLRNIQKASVFSTALIYYVSVSDRQMCSLCNQKIQQLKGNDDMKQTASLVYRIFVEKKKDDLAIVEEKLKTSSGPSKQFYKQLMQEILNLD
ncbi:hypothetical protein MOZ60_08480 [Stecheria sp. CLA-KB-P133]|uniref:Uncharacterized protein n=1 Tax=Grylomicrobium aquisgranensis TaxID=2926318 RepID=A0AB35U6H9_9FIRM|nr:hypothetical protein [Stecheria sp. CLA-KB-P133]